MNWYKIETARPYYNPRKDSLGTQVLIWPHHESVGSASSPVAFFGVRISDEPNFYLNGAVINPTHWAYLPKGPKE